MLAARVRVIVMAVNIRKMVLLGMMIAKSFGTAFAMRQTKPKKPATRKRTPSDFSLVVLAALAVWTILVRLVTCEAVVALATASSPSSVPKVRFSSVGRLHRLL